MEISKQFMEKVVSKNLYYFEKLQLTEKRQTLIQKITQKVGKSEEINAY